MIYSTDISNTFEVFKSRFGKERYPVYWLLLVLVVGTLGALPFIPVEISSQARGMVRPRLDNAVLAPVVSGKIERVCLADHQFVKAGDTLLIIESGWLQAEYEALRVNEIEYSSRMHDVLLLSEGVLEEDSLQTGQYRQSYARYKKQLNSLEVRLAQANREQKRNEKVWKQGAISHVEYCQYKDAQENARSELVTFVNQQKSAWREEAVQISDQLVQVRSGQDRIRSEQRKYTVTAPYSGTLICSSDYREGGFVNAGQTLAELSSDSDFIVACYVSPADIGYVFVGQQVSLQFDTFDYNQWGLGKAEVYEIDTNLRTAEQGAWFMVKCKLLTDTLTLKNGYCASIQKGMTLTARFRLTQRTLWQLLYDRMDDWMNPKVQEVS